MTRLNWTELDHIFENGVDQGVLYPHNAEPVPWVGLSSVVERPPKDTLLPLYYEGEVYDLISHKGERMSSVTAYTYPDEFDSLTRLTTRDPYGIAYGEQEQGYFSMSYRTMYSDGENYKITVLFNQKASLSDTTFNTISPNNTPTQFVWDFRGVPITFSDTIKTSYVVLDSNYIDRPSMLELEKFLYGDDEFDASIEDFINLVKVAAERHGKYIITHNQNGEFTLRGPDSLLSESADRLEFTAKDIKATLDPTRAEYTADDERG